MRFLALLSFLIFNSINSFALTIGPGFGKSVLFNDNWLFELSDNDKYKSINFNDKQWRQLSLPHDWSIEGQLSQNNASCTGYLPAGIAWYRKHFNYRKDKDYPLTYIYFEGIYNRSEVYLNGNLVGNRPNGYVSFLYDMSKFLKEGDNVLAVRVDHSRMADSRWYTGSGIYRDVYIVKAPRVHFSQWGTNYRLNSISNNTALIDIDIRIDDLPVSSIDYTIDVFITDKNNSVVSQNTINHLSLTSDNLITTSLKVVNPMLWSVDNPYLYNISVDLKYKGKIIDNTCFSAGFRTLKFTPDNGFELNGKNMKVKGVCLHHDAGVLGAVVPKEVWRRRVRALKTMGANAIRMSHNMQAPVLYDICDEEGMLVMDEASDEWEFPKRKWITGWNNGKPGYDGTFDFFEEWIDTDVADMVRRDRNHPSIFLWSIGNEVDYPNDPYSHPILDGTSINQPMFGGYKPEAPNAERIGIIAKRLADVIRANDMSRPVTGALAGVVMSNQTIYPDVIDVVGYNYTENRYDEDHKTYPNRIIYGSETGVGYDAWKAVRDKDFIFGQFVWTGTDYLGESGKWPSRGLNTGLLNFGNFKKPRGWFRQSLWAEVPMIYIGTMPIRQQRRQENNRDEQRRQRRNFFNIEAMDFWNYQNGSQVMVVCYTNQPQARLMLNGNEIGELKQYNDTIGGISWTIPYQHGKLEAQALNKDGIVVAKYSVCNEGKPVKLSVKDLTNEGLAYNDNPQDATFLQLLVIIEDIDGNQVKMANNEIVCDIKGDAILLGMEASNNSDMSDYTDNKHNAYRGEILVYIKKESKEPIEINFTSDGLKSVSYTR